MLRRRIWWAVSIAASLAVVSCKKTPAPVADDDILQTAIETQGDVKKLKAGSVFTSRYEGVLMGIKINGAMKYRSGATWLEYISPTKDPVIQVASSKECWQKLGRVVLPCHKAMHEHTTRLGKLLEASWLWPLRPVGAAKYKTRKMQLADKDHNGLTIIGAGGGDLGTLHLDKKTDLVTGLEMQTTLMGKTGRFVAVFNKFEKHCGIQIPAQREYRFLDMLYRTEKISGVICEAVDKKIMERPAQVKQGHIELKHKGESSLACTRFKGPYGGVEGAMDKLMASLSKHGLAPAGPLQLIHRKGPPKIKAPARFVTDVCFPVGKKSLLVPSAVWKKGEFFLVDLIADEVLAIFGAGDHVKTSTELPALLVADAKKRGRKQVGPLVQILYMSPKGGFPAPLRVSEIHLTPN